MNLNNKRETFAEISRMIWISSLAMLLCQSILLATNHSSVLFCLIHFTSAILFVLSIVCSGKGLSLSFDETFFEQSAYWYRYQTVANYAGLVLVAVSLLLL